MAHFGAEARLGSLNVEELKDKPQSCETLDSAAFPKAYALNLRQTKAENGREATSSRSVRYEGSGCWLVGGSVLDVPSRLVSKRDL